MSDTKATQTDNGEAAAPTAEELEAAVEPTPDPNAVAITINGKAVTARKGEFVIAAADRAGEYIPRFCYHERMSSVGMCRMCLVEVDTGRGPALQPSCMVTVTPDMKVDTESANTKRAQEGILELLLANHPLDCPVCDKGGECPLQDQAFSHGPGESRYVEEKRHYEKPIAISDLVQLDRERCILCDRCTRFADEVAGDALIHFIQRGNETQVMTFPDEPFGSYFSGNTVQICPVGALTATPYRFKARPWDLAEDESTCTGCAVGCRISVQSTRDEVVRYLGVDSEAVNWGWLCDKGRFGFEALKSTERLRTPLERRDGELVETNWNRALQRVADAIRDTSKDRIALLGGARGTNEDAFAWAQLADAIGIQHRDAQLADGLPPAVLSLPRATIDETTAAPTIILLGPDPKEELGALYLRLRHVFEQRTAKLVELTPMATGLTRSAWRSHRVESGDRQAALEALGADDVRAQLAAGPVVIVAGRANLAESEQAATSLLAAVWDAVSAVQPDVKLLPALRRGNVTGALQLGLAPTPDGRDAAGILRAAAAGKLDVLILLGSDPVTDFPGGALADAVAKVPTVVAIDTHSGGASEVAHVVLPAAAFTEKHGTTTNLEGRVTTVAKRVTVAGNARPDWMIATELADLLDHDALAAELSSLESITAAIAKRVPAYVGATAAAISAGRDGVLARPVDDPRALADRGNFDATKRNSYDFRLVLSRKLYDDSRSVSNSPSLAPLVGDGGAFVNPADVNRIGVSDGGAVRLVSSGGTAQMTLRTSAAIPRGTVWVPWNRDGNVVRAVVDITAAVTDVRIEVA